MGRTPWKGLPPRTANHTHSHSNSHCHFHSHSHLHSLQIGSAMAGIMEDVKGLISPSEEESAWNADSCSLSWTQVRRPLTGFASLLCVYLVLTWTCFSESVGFRYLLRPGYRLRSDGKTHQRRTFLSVPNLMRTSNFIPSLLSLSRQLLMATLKSKSPPHTPRPSLPSM